MWAAIITELLRLDCRVTLIVENRWSNGVFLTVENRWSNGVTVTGLKLFQVAITAGILEHVTGGSGPFDGSGAVHERMFHWVHFRGIPVRPSLRSSFSPVLWTSAAQRENCR